MKKLIKDIKTKPLNAKGLLTVGQPIKLANLQRRIVYFCPNCKSEYGVDWLNCPKCKHKLLAKVITGGWVA